MSNNETEQPRTWGEMTDAEKGALLLAAHEGKTIGVGDKPTWCEGTHMGRVFFDNVAYRIKPEPKRETVTLYHGPDDTAAFTGYNRVNDDVVITYTRTDGEPDLDSIHMVAINDPS